MCPVCGILADVSIAQTRPDVTIADSLSLRTQIFTPFRTLVDSRAAFYKAALFITVLF